MQSNADNNEQDGTVETSILEVFWGHLSSMAVSIRLMIIMTKPRTSFEQTGPTAHSTCLPDAVGPTSKIPYQAMSLIIQ